jgi:3-deoxy-D-manno-octulosonic-acid transferase
MGSSGLHNILEACIYNKPVIIGKNYAGFIEAEQLVESGGVASVKDYNEFKLEIEKLIYDKKNIMDKANIISNYIKTKTGALSVIQKQL